MVSNGFFRNPIRRTRLMSAVGIVALVVAMPGIAVAQVTQESEASQETTDAQGDEIVVTAQGREERLQDVPVSAQVVGELARVASNTNSLEALAKIQPSIRINSGGRSSDMYVRGTGSGGNQSFDQSVGLFVDNIYHGRSRITGATFLDLDRVEILKGPQSIFFGNNAIAGALNVVTKKPGDAIEASARVLLSPTSGTNGGQYAIEGAIGVPLNDWLGVRVAATYNGQQGWLENVSTGNLVPKEENFAFRGTVRIHPGRWDVTIKGEFSRNVNEGGYYLQNENCPPSAPFTTGSTCAVIVNGGYPTGLDNNQMAVNDGSVFELENQEYVMNAAYELDSGHTITSVTGYYRYDFLMNLDTDGTPVALLHVQTPERQSQFSQELRFASPVGQPIEYIAGLYYQSGRSETETYQSYFFLNGTISGSAAFAGLVPYLPIGQGVWANQDEQTYSAFASVTWNVTDRLKLNAGLRATKVSKQFDWELFYGTATQTFGGLTRLPSNVVSLLSPLNLGNTGTLALERSDSALMPSARVQYQLTPDVMAYASYSRGFKAGGFNFADNTANAANYPFGPETVNAFEAGLKSQLFDRALTFNVAAFRSEYEDLQVSINTATGSGAYVSLVRNAAKSRSQGIEVETVWQVVPAFRLSAAGSYIDSIYVSYPNAGPTNAQQQAAQQVQDLSGRPTPFSPKWSGNLTGTLTVPVGDFQLTAEATGIYSSSYYMFATLDPLHFQDAYTRLDARLTIETADHRWAFDVIGKNLTDAVIRTQSNNQALSRGSILVQKVQPSNIAFQLRFRW